MDRVLFACRHNAGRSQMAAALFARLADPARATAVSAGTTPADRVHPEAAQAMQELGIDLSSARPQLLTPELAAGSRLLITMGCGEECPYVPGLEVLDWALDDPKGRPLEEVRRIRDEISRRVAALVSARGWGRKEGAGDRRVRWGVLGAARIAVQKVIPAMQRGRLCEVRAIASRDIEKARRAAAALGIARAYGSYEELLDDPEIEAVYNPLPNHLHVPWSIRALERGKHVLCEKPIGLDAAEAEALLAARDRTGRKVQEAFMVRTHPQWLTARKLVLAGRIGTLRSIACAFSYHNEDPANVRHVPEWGGGALLDIGCYPITVSRFLFDQEPVRVVGLLERDPRFGTDRLVSAVLDFPSGHATFTCGTQLVPYQRVELLGTGGRIEVEIPFNAPNDRPCRLWLDDGRDLFGGGIETLLSEACDQYTIQGDRFSQAILEDTAVATPLEDAVANMRVLAAVLRSAESGRWEAP
jgi:predicted dehydrogenase/protein-tyrosine-phosphatase